MSALVSDPVMSLLFGLSVTLTVGLVLMAFTGGDRKGKSALDARLLAAGLVSVASVEPDDEARAREEIQKALNELEATRQREGRFLLARLLKSSGTERSVERHLGYTAAATVVMALVLWLLDLPLLQVALGAVGLGIGAPLLQVRILARRRLKLFTDDLPDALDLMVRGVRAGLPLIECLRLAATEWRDPLRRELFQIMNDLGVGLSMREAVARFADRVPVREARLFAIVVAIQAQSGGNIAEVLTNLANLLRDKATLQGKLRSMTAEARTSALIIGAVPVLLIGALSLLAPDFLRPLIDTETGNIIVGASLGWMLVGVVVMRSMMRIEL